jgi:aldehyde:ferredoxin oxidoreductase
MSHEEIFAASLKAQITSAAQDSLGMCVFGRTVNDKEAAFIVEMINSAIGTNLTTDFYMDLGRDALRCEWEFNKQAGFGVADDELPAFFYNEPLAPSNNVARFHADDVQGTPKQV